MPSLIEPRLTESQLISLPHPQRVVPFLHVMAEGLPYPTLPATTSPGLGGPAWVEEKWVSW